MSSIEQKNFPDWARRERAGDLAWISANTPSFWPIAQGGFETLGRGAIVVDTTVRLAPIGHPFGYLPQDLIAQSGDQDAVRMVAEYDPQAEMVTMLLKTQARVSTYRIRVVR